MGADIHMVLERRWEDKWVGVNAFPYVKGTIYDWPTKDDAPSRGAATGSIHWPTTSRNYDLFAALAGVRGYGPTPRGVPEDASDLALMEIEGWGSDGHSHTFMLLSEALPLFVQHGQFGTPDKAVLKAFARGTSAPLIEAAEFFYSPTMDGDTPDNYRLIMWFDN